jgi:3',5'-nucleoside bisphosphate phosphatase
LHRAHSNTEANELPPLWRSLHTRSPQCDAIVAGFDLQAHSTESDGTLRPSAVVSSAAAAGIELLALSDHDTVDGVPEALEAGWTHGVQIVPAAELSSVSGEHEDLHVLGYRIDHEDPGLKAALADYREDRARRIEAMAQLLRDDGWALDEDALRRRRDAGKPLGRPHLAQAAFGHEANARRIEAEGLETFSDLLVAYLIPGAPAYRARTHPTVEQAIATIHAAGGVAVWAHPFWDMEQPQQALDTIDRFQAAGLDGVEVFYVTHTEEQTLFLADACAERDLLMTGSADFHGPDHPRFNAFGTFELYGREPVLGPIAP